MSRTRTTNFARALLLMAIAAAQGASSAQARLRLRVAPEPVPAAEVLLPPPAHLTGATCCPTVQACYRDLTRCRGCCDPCAAGVPLALKVCHPCTGCPVLVPVCVPACCTGCPQVFSRGALVGQGLVRFTWCCGFSATVRFDRCGDVLVTYRN